MRTLRLIAIYALLLFVFVRTTNAAFTSAPEMRELELEYKTIVSNDTLEDEGFKLWIPLASMVNGQEVSERQIEVSQGLDYQIRSEAKYQNEMLYISSDTRPADDLEIVVNYRIRRHPQIEFPDSPQIDPYNQVYLQPSKLMIIDQLIQRRANEIVAGKTSVEEKARAIYDYVFNHVDYDKQVPGWGQGDTKRVCAVGKGNCTDFHSLFISLARAAGIPSRFQIGFQVPEASEGTIKGYHCWAQYYVDDAGWQTVDISEAWKNPAKKEYYFGGFDPNKVMLSTGRDIALEPAQQGTDLNYFFYPYLEHKDGSSLKPRTQFSYREISS